MRYNLIPIVVLAYLLTNLSKVSSLPYSAVNISVPNNTLSIDKEVTKDRFRRNEIYLNEENLNYVDAEDGSDKEQLKSEGIRRIRRSFSTSIGNFFNNIFGIVTNVSSCVSNMRSGGCPSNLTVNTTNIAQPITILGNLTSLLQQNTSQLNNSLTAVTQNLLQPLLLSIANLNNLTATNLTPNLFKPLLQSVANLSNFIAALNMSLSQPNTNLNLITTPLTQLLLGLTSLITQLVQALSNFISQIVQALSNFISLLGGILNGILQFLQIVNLIIQLLPTLISIIQSLTTLNSPQSSLTNLLPTFSQILQILATLIVAPITAGANFSATGSTAVGN